MLKGLPLALSTMALAVRTPVEDVFDDWTMISAADDD
jgi:hypothetical protein